MLSLAHGVAQGLTVQVFEDSDDTVFLFRGDGPLLQPGYGVRGQALRRSQVRGGGMQSLTASCIPQVPAFT